MCSQEHQIFLKKLKRKNRSVKFTQIIILVLFLFIWQLAASLGLINTFISSSPKDVLETILGLIKGGELWYHVWVTTYETIISFLLGTFLGFLIATILWWFPFLAKVLDPYLTILNSLPKVALGPIIIIWAGAGKGSIILMALFISVIITIINVYQSFVETDIHKIKLLESWKATKWQIYTKLIMPSSLQTMVNALKINVSMSLIGIIMGEFLVSKEGIGYLIMYGSQVFNLDLVMSGVIILGVVATVMYYAVNFVEKKLLKNKY